MARAACVARVVFQWSDWEPPSFFSLPVRESGSLAMPVVEPDDHAPLDGAVRRPVGGARCHPRPKQKRPLGQHPAPAEAPLEGDVAVDGDAAAGDPPRPRY